jgi:Putative prokaryotic signal transducing protein
MPQDPSNPVPDMVVVLETSDRIQFAMAKGLLEDAGIPLYISGEIATLVQELDPFLHKKVCLQVPRNRDAEARKILEQFHQPVR